MVKTISKINSASKFKVIHLLLIKIVNYHSMIAAILLQITHKNDFGELLKL